MAGDHACTVCQATFTRPQHVARHMRSHTGDRPYKCQHCGDQFSRSDLLNRHIKKCHPDAEDPTANKDGGKRKTNAINRAVTSKQACDQCVQSSLPCNGANPCSKCVQRKVRCTYVMFHRQTAPAGPGHPAATPFASNPYELPSSQFAYAPPPTSHHSSYVHPPPPHSYDGSMGRYGRSASLSYHDHPRPTFDMPASAGHNRGLSMNSESSNGSHVPFDFDLEFEDSQPSQSVDNMYGRSNMPINYQYPNGGAASHHLSHPEQPRPSSSHFHSAFGLLSLEDPKTENNTPFFSNHGQPTDIPTRPSPESVSAASSYSSSSSGFHPGSSRSSYSSVSNMSDASWKESMDPLQPPREAETRELREFWRQYQSQSQPPDSSSHSHYENGASVVTPSASGQRQRMNTVNMKTPTADAYTSGRDEGDNYGWYPPGTAARAAAGVGVVNHNARPTHEHHPAPPPIPSSQQQPPPPPHSSAADDLKSYEAAVMARQVNTDLIMPSISRHGQSLGAGAGSGPSDRPNFKRLPSSILAPDSAKKVRG